MSTSNNNADSPLNNNSPYLDHLNECEIMYCLSVVQSESGQWWKTVARKAAEQMNVRKRQVGEMNVALGQLRVRAEAAERQVQKLIQTIAQLENQLRTAKGEPLGRDHHDLIGDHHDHHSQQSSTSIMKPPAANDDDDEE